MRAVARTRYLASVLLVGASMAAVLSATAVTILPGGLAATKSGGDFVLSFLTTGPLLYSVQVSPDLIQPWTELQSGIPGDGTVKTVTVTNSLSGDKGFYRLLIQTPMKLLLPQSQAFAILGHSCGGIKEQVYVTGFDPSAGYPTGNVYLSTTCSTGGRGSRPATFTAWAAVTWDLTGNVISSVALSNAAAINPTFTASDAYRDFIYNLNTSAYFVVPTPAAPANVTAVQSGDDFQISWTPNAVNPAAVTSSTATATPVNSDSSTLMTTVIGPATSAVISSLEPQTTYQITVVNTTISGSSPPSNPLNVTTVPASILPSAPVGVAAHWLIPDPSGTTDTLVATWQAADPGNSPIDQYRITINGSDGGGAFTQTVSGTTLTANFTVDYIPNWSVTVQAHNAVGWGPASAVVMLGGL